MTGGGNAHPLVVAVADPAASYLARRRFGMKNKLASIIAASFLTLSVSYAKTRPADQVRETFSRR
jgi:hypothetical protein